MKGILFKPWKQKAIRESPFDKLWQTRRLDYLKEINQEPAIWFVECETSDTWVFASDNGEGRSIKPHYRVGETVYIKETWATEKRLDHLKPSEIGTAAYVPLWYIVSDKPTEAGEPERGRRRSPMFMPQWAARTFIKITSIRPERLNDITEEDIEAEGTRVWLNQHPEILGYAPFSARTCFSYLWDSINPKHPWANNDWVWVYSFRKEDKSANL